jgi:hypothetical protein
MGMNLGIIGAGAIGNVHADTATRAGIPIAGVWDVNPAKGAAFSVLELDEDADGAARTKPSSTSAYSKPCMLYSPGRSSYGSRRSTAAPA